jgi:hypothetical protein
VPEGLSVPLVTWGGTAKSGLALRCREKSLFTEIILIFKLA